MSRRVPALNWVTHLPTPFRAPVYREIARRYDLEVQLMERSYRVGEVGSENRGSDWRTDHFPDVPWRELRTIRLRWRSVPLYAIVGRSGARSVAKADLVLINGWEHPAYWQALLLCKILKKPSIGFYESPARTNKFSRGAIARFRSRVFRSFDVIVTPGVAATEAVVSMGVERARIFEGFNAVDTEVFAKVLGESAMKRDFHRFVYVGQLIHRKRITELLQAFAENSGPNDELWIVGAGMQKAALQSSVISLGVSERVTFIEHVLNSQLPSILRNCDTLCLVSSDEVWGLVVNEALASGLHVVVTENCGVAPSVASMSGVAVVRTDLSDLGSAIRSRAGAMFERIEKPEILEHTPEAFADVFDRAFAFARGHQ